MVVDWDSIEFNEYELRIINKFCYKRRFCDNGHYDEKSLIHAVDNAEIGFMRDALKKLLRLNIVKEIKKQNRHDYCFPKESYTPSILILKKYARQYDFIDKSICDMKIKKHG